MTAAHSKNRFPISERSTHAASGSSNQKSVRLAALLLLIFTVGCFYPVCTHEFTVWDDGINVAANPRMNPPTLGAVVEYWRRPFLGLYIPMSYTVWTAMAEVAHTPTPDAGGNSLNPYVFHTGNLILHITAVMLAFALLMQLVGNPWAAAAGAALFAIHPLQVEPVAWVTGLRDVLGGMLCILSMWLYLRARTPPMRPGRFALHVLAIVCFALACLSKTTSVVAPVMLLAIDLLLLLRPIRTTVTALLPWVAIALAATIVAHAVQPGAATAQSVPLMQRPLIAVDALGFYAAKLLWPVHLGIDYGRTPAYVAEHVGGYAVLGCGLVILMLGALIRRAFVVATAIAVFMVGVLPVLGLVPFEFQKFSTVADRYAYLSLLGPALLLASGCTRIAPRANVVRLFRGAVIAVLVALGILAWRQTFTWRDDFTLFNHAVAINPRTWLAHTNLSNRYAAMDDADSALRESGLALQNKPNDPIALTTLGFAWTMKNDFAKAADAFTQAATADPKNPNVRRDLAGAMTATGRYAEATIQYRLAIRLAPRDPRPHTDFGLMLIKQGQRDQAIAEFAAALALAPSDPDAREALIKAKSLP